MIIVCMTCTHVFIQIVTRLPFDLIIALHPKLVLVLTVCSKLAYSDPVPSLCDCVMAMPGGLKPAEPATPEVQQIADQVSVLFEAVINKITTTWVVVF